MRVNFAVFTGAVLSFLTVLSLPVQAQTLAQLELLAGRGEPMSSIKQPLGQSKKSSLLILLTKQSLPTQAGSNLITEFAAASVGQDTVGGLSTAQAAPAVSPRSNEWSDSNLSIASRHITDNSIDKNSCRHSYKNSDRHSDRHSDRNSDRHSDRHSDRNSYKNSDRHSCKIFFGYTSGNDGLKRVHKISPKSLPILETLISNNELETTQTRLVDVELIDATLIIESPQSVRVSATENSVTSYDVELTRALPSLEEVQQIQQDLRNLDIPEPVRNRRRVYPGITISNPTGYGADRGQIFAGIGFQSRTRFSGGTNVGTIFGGGKRDGTAGIGFGLGDAREFVGLQISYTAASFGGSREPLSGGINAKIHRQFGNRWAAAIGGEGIINFGRLPEDDDEIEFNDFEGTYYGALTKTINLREDFHEPLSRLTFTGGIGTGRFRSVEAIANGEFGVGIFGSVALQVLPSTSLIAEWTGQDLAAGISVAPFPNFPLVFTPAVRDIAGEGDGDPRFVLGVGISIRDAIAALGL